MNHTTGTASFCEEQFYLLSEYNKDILDGTISAKLLFKTPPNLERLHAAIETTYMNYEGFHVKYKLEGRTLLKIPHRKMLSFKQITASYLELTKIEDAFFSERINLDTSPLCSFLLVCMENGEHNLLIRASHIVTDGVSFMKMVSNLGKTYSGEEADSYTNYKLPIAHQSSGDYWREYLSSCDDFLHLELRNKQDSLNSFGRIDLAIEENAAKQIIGRLKKRGISPLIYISWALSLAVARNTHQSKIGFVHPVSLHNKGTASGCLINQLPVHVTLLPGSNIIDQLLLLRSDIKKNLSHKDYPYSDIIRNIGAGAGKNGIPPYDISINPTILRRKVDTFDDLEVILHSKNVQHLRPMTFNYDFTSNSDFTVFFDRGFFSDQLMANIMADFKSVFESAVEHLDQNINASLYSRDIFLAARRGAKKEVDFRMMDIIRNIAKNTPNAVAVMENDRCISYAQLIKDTDALSNAMLLQHACELNSRRLDKTILAAVYMDKGYNQLRSILACLNLNIGYIPIDTKTPTKRIVDIFFSTQPFVVLSDTDDSDLLGLTPWINVTSTEAHCFPQSLEINPVPYDSSRTAYVIPTSGSTGKPKIIDMSFRGLNNMALSLADYFNLSPKECMLNFSSAMFDTSTCEIFSALLRGAKLSIPTEESKKDISILANLMKAHGVTHAMLTPSLVWLMRPKDIKLIPHVIIMGEKFDVALVNKISQCGSNVYNLYGPSESNACTVTKLTPQSEVHLGESMYNCIHYVVDQFAIPVLPGSYGELAIAGDCLSDGYIEGDNKPFVNLPLQNEVLAVYLSKDLVYINGDNNLIYIDRLTSEIKINGFRVDTKEVEAAIRSYQDGILCAVIVEKRSSGSTLKAFVSEHCQNQEALKKWLSNLLPYYMIPHNITYCEIPLNNNKKIDYIALKLINEASPEITEEAKSLQKETFSDTERNIVGLWENILNIQINSFDNNFFNLGGDSLSAINLATELSTIYALNISTAFVYNYPTISAQVEKLTREKYNPNDQLSCLSHAANGKKLFIVHPTAAGSEIYYRLGAKLQEKINLIGVNSYNLNNSSDPVFCIKTLAAIYGEYIIGHQSNGPYYLAGWSSGGNIAHAVASYLMSKGHCIDSVFILDSFNFSGLVNSELFDYLQQPGSDWYDRFLDDQLNRNGVSDEFLHKVKTIIQLEKESVVSRMLAHTPDKLPCAITLFKAMRPRKFKLKELNSESGNNHNTFGQLLIGLQDNGWAEAAASLKVVEVDADHGEMVSQDLSLSLISEHIIASMQ